jgi:hypothetical protein
MREAEPRFGKVAYVPAAHWGQASMLHMDEAKMGIGPWMGKGGSTDPMSLKQGRRLLQETVSWNSKGRGFLIVTVFQVHRLKWTLPAPGSSHQAQIPALFPAIPMLWGGVTRPSEVRFLVCS